MRHLLSLLLLSATLCAAADPVEITVGKKAGAVVQPTMYGAFFEDINYAADGGLYAELVKNRSFEFPQTLMGWQAFGNVSIGTDGPFPRCPHYVTLRDAGHHDRHTGLTNEGYFGIGITRGAEYRFTVWARAEGDSAALDVQLIDPYTDAEQQQFASKRLTVSGSKWQKYELVLKAGKSVDKAQLRLFLKSATGVSLDHVSLFPVDTYKGRANGMRRDIAEALAEAHPGVLRFPGGCIVEGVDLPTRYQWKNTVGPVENRPLNENRWEYTFAHRFYPDYFQSYGLGFFEFFQLAEDIGAQPLPVLNVGMACQYQNWNKPSAHVPVDSLKQYIDDCLDLIEFANGDTTTTWGALRAQMGHPAPFNMTMIGVGNEQWDNLYYERLKPFVAAIRARYPKMKIVGTSGPDPSGDKFDRGWQAMREQKVDLVDEHFYRNEQWFASNITRYDSYDRRGPKVFAGEYACHSKGKKRNRYAAAIWEAAFMTGMERNADVVHMTAYAPLFAHRDGWQWRPDLIWFDNTRTIRTASYYVQQLYATNAGTNVLPCTGTTGQPLAGTGNIAASAVLDKAAGTIIVKVVNTAQQPQDIAIALQGLTAASDVTVNTLTCDNPNAENTFEHPDCIVPATSTLRTTAGKPATLRDTVPAMTFRVYVVKK